MIAKLTKINLLSKRTFNAVIKTQSHNEFSMLTAHV